MLVQGRYVGRGGAGNRIAVAKQAQNRRDHRLVRELQVSPERQRGRDGKTAPLRLEQQSAGRLVGGCFRGKGLSI